MRKITCENGHTYSISAQAFEALKSAKHAGEAESAFNQFAPHVPRRDRCQVWFAI